MNEMKENPATPLTMTAEAELAEWIEGANNVTIQKTVQLKRVSARIDLVVAPQAGLTFTVKDIKMKSRANSYLFPNDAPYIVEGVVELTGTAGEGSTDADGNTAYTSLLYPYETPGGVVTEVEVSGSVQAGEVTKEVTFAVPFTNEPMQMAFPSSATTAILCRLPVLMDSILQKQPSPLAIGAQVRHREICWQVKN